MNSKTPNGSIDATISIGGNHTGAITVGHGNTVVVNNRTKERTALTSQERASFEASLKTLRERIHAEAPASDRDAALAQVDRLEKAILPHPDVSRMEKVRDWFAKHLPELAGAVTTVFINPIVGKIVEAAGEMAAEAFRKRFGHAG